MKGIVFNLFEEVVVDEYGEDCWDDLLDAAGLAGAYTSLGSYPDDEVIGLVGAASSALGLAPADILRWFGRNAMPKLAVRYPHFFTAQTNSRDFVLSVNSLIHPEVRKLYAGAGCPNFNFEEGADGALIVGYRSPRRLCRLAQGFIEGAAAHYDEVAAVTHLACMNEGDPACRIAIAWES